MHKIFTIFHNLAQKFYCILYVTDNQIHTIFIHKSTPAQFFINFIQWVC